MIKKSLKVKNTPRDDSLNSMQASLKAAAYIYLVPLGNKIGIATKIVQHSQMFHANNLVVNHH